MNNQMNKTVGIIGAGPVGMTLAARLADFGISSVILDKAPHLLPKGSKACLIQGDALETLEKLGIGDTIGEEGIHWRIARTYIRNVERITQEYPEREGYAEFVNISQYRIEQELEHWINQHPMSEIKWNHELTSYTDNGDNVTVNVNTENGLEQFTFRYLVACDGVRSKMRDLSGVPFTGYTHKDRFLITDIKANLPQTKERHFHFDPDFNPGRQLVMHPQPDNIWRIDWQLPPDADIEKEKENGELEKRIRRVIGDIPYNIEWISVYRFHQRVIDNFKLGNVFFAGDAAHSYPPYGSRGMNSGIQDADNLAWKFNAVIRGKADETLLDTYHTERYAAAQENLKVTEATIKFMVPPSPIKRIVRNMVLWASVPFKGLRNSVNHGRMTEPFTYKASPMIVPDDNPYVGRFAPDTRIFEDNQRTRLRKFIGHGFLCLYMGPPERLPEFCRAAAATRSAVDVAFVAAMPKGDAPPVALVEQEKSVTVVFYDDILFAEQFKLGDHVVYLIRPDGHIASNHRLDNTPSFTSIIEQISGCPVTDFNQSPLMTKAS